MSRQYPRPTPESTGAQVEPDLALLPASGKRTPEISWIWSLWGGARLKCPIRPYADFVIFFFFWPRGYTGGDAYLESDELIWFYPLFCAQHDMCDADCQGLTARKCDMYCTERASNVLCHGTLHLPIWVIRGESLFDIDQEYPETIHDEIEKENAEIETDRNGK